MRSILSKKKDSFDESNEDKARSLLGNDHMKDMNLVKGVLKKSKSNFAESSLADKTATPTPRGGRRNVAFAGSHKVEEEVK